MNSLPAQIFTDVGSPNDALVERAWGAALTLVAHDPDHDPDRAPRLSAGAALHDQHRSAEP